MARNFASGTTDSLINTSIAAVGSTGTIALWFKPNWSSGDGVARFLTAWALTGTVSTTDARIQIERFNDNHVYAGPFHMDGSTDARVNVADTGLFVSGTWAHHCITWNQPGNSVVYYVNGVSKGTGGAGPAFTQSCTYGVVGNLPATWGAGTQTSFGAMAESGFWTVALTAFEVAALAKGVRNKAVRGKSLVWYLPVDGSVSPEPDLSGNAKNATVTGTTSAFGPPIAMFTPRGPQVGPGPPPPILMGQSMFQM